ncbi:hypothetical protein VIGAN_01368600 [Vigna angularis var. angularis]|uniref:Pectinesterase inhibitor domain-containing protein n=2 Tax=Phaseolus angularis TaxID=3914 RepID=A0A0S3R5L5_PHAAN|nr:hypothetical protein VIGAN_01368600 [Vigna angularis var. angularis]
MKLSAYLIIIFSIFFSQCSSVSNLVSEACMEASKFDQGLSYDFCVAHLFNWQPPSSNVEDYWVKSIQLLKSNGTNVLSFISKLLNDKRFDERTKDSLKGCFDSYKDTMSELDAAVVAFKAKDLDTAGIKVSESLDTPLICQRSFNDPKGRNLSPLTSQNNAYFKLNVIPLVLIQIFTKHS